MLALQACVLNLTARYELQDFSTGRFPRTFAHFGD